MARMAYSIDETRHFVRILGVRLFRAVCLMAVVALGAFGFRRASFGRYDGA